VTASKNSDQIVGRKTLRDPREAQEIAIEFDRVDLSDIAKAGTTAGKSYRRISTKIGLKQRPLRADIPPGAKSQRKLRHDPSQQFGLTVGKTFGRRVTKTLSTSSKSPRAASGSM
jgi:hypothetical protein